MQIYCSFIEQQVFSYLLLLKFLQVFFVFLTLGLIRWANGVLPAVGALLRLPDSAEYKMTVITGKNHFSSPATL